MLCALPQPAPREPPLLLFLRSLGARNVTRRDERRGHRYICETLCSFPIYSLPWSYSNYECMQQNWNLLLLDSKSTSDLRALSSIAHCARPTPRPTDVVSTARWRDGARRGADGRFDL